METLMKADIFFFVTTIAVGLVAVFLIIALCYIMRTFTRLRMLIEKVEANVHEVNIHTMEIVEQIKESTIFNFLFKKKTKKKSR